MVDAIIPEGDEALDSENAHFEFGGD